MTQSVGTSVLDERKGRTVIRDGLGGWKTFLSHQPLLVKTLLIGECTHTTENSAIKSFHFLAEVHSGVQLHVVGNHFLDYGDENK